MKKLTILTLLIGSTSIFASGTGSCDGVASSGCGAWWQNYSLGSATDGVFSQSSGVGLSYTANFTSVAASQDPLTATFPWISNDPLMTSNTSQSYGSLLSGLTGVVGSTSNTVSGTSSGSFGDLLLSALSTGTSVVPSTTITPASTTNIASMVPTYTTGSVNIAVVADSGGSYSNYLAQIYGLAYGNQSNSMNINPNAVGFADPIIPEPSSYISMGFGLIAVIAYARRKRAGK